MSLLLVIYEEVYPSIKKIWNKKWNKTSETRKRNQEKKVKKWFIFYNRMDVGRFCKRKHWMFDYGKNRQKQLHKWSRTKTIHIYLFFRFQSVFTCLLPNGPNNISIQNTYTIYPFKMLLSYAYTLRIVIIESLSWIYMNLKFLNISFALCIYANKNVRFAIK